MLSRPSAAVRALHAVRVPLVSASTLLSAQRRCFGGSPDQMASLVMGALKKKAQRSAAASASSTATEAAGSTAAARRGTTSKSPSFDQTTVLTTTFSLPPAGTLVPGEEQSLPSVPTRVRRTFSADPTKRADTAAAEEADVRRYPRYLCACCEKPLFSLCPAHCGPLSAAGSHQTGWPSFVRPIVVEAITILASKALRSIPIEDEEEGGEGAAGSGTVSAVDDDDDTSLEDFRNRGEFRADPQVVSSTACTPVMTAAEIRLRHSRIEYDKYGNIYEKRKMLDSIKVAKRLWKGNRGDANHSSTVFIGQCAGCRTDVCFVSMPASRNPSFVVNAKAVTCVPGEGEQ